ncbi:C40 family peptidase [bacterium]|nr:C40 family peptidase [bacterium]
MSSKKIWLKHSFFIASAALFASALLGTDLSLAQGAYKYYEVMPGDTVYSISTRFGVSSKELLRLNSRTIIDGKGLQAGSILMLPAGAKPENEFPAPTPLNISAADSASGQQSAASSKPVKHKESKSAYNDKNAPLPSQVALHTSRRPSVEAPSADSPLAAYTRNKNKRRSKNTRGYSIAVGSDGQIVKIPNYVDKHAAPEQGVSKEAQELLAQAKSYMGVPYVWGGASPSGFDCSGYVQYVYGQVGIDLPRTADVQFNAGDKVDAGEEAPGDMVFFETYAPGASHVGIYLGDGEFIHASSSGCVRISSLEEDYFKARYLGAKRVL